MLMGVMGGRLRRVVGVEQRCQIGCSTPFVPVLRRRVVLGGIWAVGDAISVEVSGTYALFGKRWWTRPNQRFCIGVFF